MLKDKEVITQKPLVPPCFFKSQNQILAHDAKALLAEVLAQSGVDPEECETVIKNFDNIVYSDCYQRLLDQKLYQ